MNEEARRAADESAATTLENEQSSPIQRFIGCPRSDLAYQTPEGVDMSTCPSGSTLLDRLGERLYNPPKQLRGSQAREVWPC